MNLWFRLAGVLLAAFSGKTIQFLESSKLNFRVFLNDLDIYGHMNNGRYLTLMDMGRIDWIIRTGLIRHTERNDWKPLVGAIKVEYKKSLQLFQPFTLVTRILAWDEKWFYIEQTFKSGDQLCARAIVRGLFRAANGNIPTEQVIQSLGLKVSSPPMENELKINLPVYSE